MQRSANVSMADLVIFDHSATRASIKVVTPKKENTMLLSRKVLLIRALVSLRSMSANKNAIVRIVPYNTNRP